MAKIKLPEGFKLKIIENSVYFTTNNGEILSMLDEKSNLFKELRVDKLKITPKFEMQIRALNNGEEIEDD